MKQIDWSALTDDEIAIIRKIVDRAMPIFREARVKITPLTVQMDVSAAHLACPLHLVDLLAADDFNFAHDIGGISRHLNRQTGELENCFVPRYAQQQGIAA